MAGEDKNKVVVVQTAKKFQKSYFDVLGICCSSEIPLIENILKPLDGVKEVKVIIATRTVIVVHDSFLVSQAQIAKALNEARLEANVRVYGEDNFKKKWPSPYSIACGVLLLLSFLKFVYRPLGWLALGAVVIGILPICLKAIASIRSLRLDINILAIVAVIGTVALGDYLEAGTIVFLFTIAEWLESRASHKANAVMSSLMSMVPQKAVIAETGEVVDADEVKLNTVLAVKAGEVIPIDGVVVEGSCEVDEKTLTGESFPVAKHKDSTVWAGTINLNGYISVKTTALAEDCAVAKMAKLVEEAQNSKSKTQRFIDKCAKYYTPVVLIISISVAVIPAVLRLHNLNKWLHLALVILVSACPCGLILSTPVATFCALTKAATSGLLIKGGDHLETLSKIKIVAFDKTGTITRGEFVVSDFRSLCDDISMETLVYWVSSIESKSSHPMAAALVDYGKSLSIEPKPDNVEEFQNFPGEGIYGRIDGKDVYIGNKKISTRASCETVPTLEGFAKDGKSVGYIYCGATPAGIFTLSDACRSGAADAIKELKSLGIKTAMLTGDSLAAAMYTNEQLKHAIEAVHAELLPEDKAKIIKEFKGEGRTAMIGDGLNDAPALATADIGISMGVSGSALATETGHVILLSNDMRKIPKAIQLARKAIGKVIQNVALSIVTKAAILALAIAGHPLVWAAVLADVGTCLLVILNSMLLLQETHNHGRKCCQSSSAPHVHKHGCNGSHNKFSPHKDHQCCSNNKAPKVCKSQMCSSETGVSKCQSRPLSSRSCCDNNCMKSAESRGDFASSDKSHEAQHCYDHGSCDRTMNYDLESQNTHEHGFVGSKTSNRSCADDNHHVLNTTGRHGGSAEGEHDGLYGSKHCSHISVSSVAEQRESSCCGKSHNNDEAHRKPVEQCGVHHHHEEDHSGSNKHNKDHTAIDIIHDGNRVEIEAKRACEMIIGKKPELKGCCENHGAHFAGSASLNACMSLEKREMGGCCKSHGAHFAGSASLNACMSLEKREMGGCCKSYLKECCSKHGHLGVALGGDLSEVVID